MWYLSTIDPRACELAQKYGLGVEIAEFCTPWNLDENFAETDETLSRKLTGIRNRILHGPFNELFPCAIDPEARALAFDRFRQTMTLARRYGADKAVLHGGFNPQMYYPCWYTEQSILFWKSFLPEIPAGVTVCVENVLEPTPESLLAIAEGVDDPGLRLCLDIGHVNAYSSVPAEDWIWAWGKRLSHLHIHNNDGTADTHSPLSKGTLDIPGLLQTLREVSPDATCTLELPDAEESVRFLAEKGEFRTEFPNAFR